ncbi:MAG TPA: oligosaccharide flippase family protein [Longimicrobium sp.]|jgi:PST family polysaccharide transporter
MEADRGYAGEPLRRTVVRETLWNTAGAYGGLVLQLVVTAILARVLSPGDFGIVAAVLAFTAFFEALAELGLVGAMLQRPDPSRAEMSGVFWLALASGGVLYLALYGGVSLLGGLFGTRGFTEILRVLGLNVFLVALLVVPKALLRGRLELRRLSLARLAGVAAGAAAAVPLALAGRGSWALVGQSLAGYGTELLAVCWFARWRPRLERGRVSARVMRFSGSMFLQIAVNYWSRNAGSLLIARFGAAPLGQFNLAQRLVGIPVQLLWSALGPVLHPAYARMADDLPRLRAAYAQLLQLTGILSLSVAAVLGLCADRLVPLLWGPQWTASIPLVYALLPVAAVQPLAAVGSPLFMARERTGLMVRLTVFNAAVLLAAMALGLRWGTAGVAWGYSIAYLCIAFPCACLAAQARVLHGTAGQLAAWLWRPLATCAIVLAGGWAARAAAGSAPPLIGLLAIAMASLLAWGLAVRALSWPLVLSVARARTAGA